ncbi:single-stranded-dna-specific exonuclease recj [hydrocarbon metagenome]|uniref:Single-stranded-DNA-specific exonuclease RecJ n=1 Tax=hydrocarbon metagenome TaxID=938273 RepID=A0A0W8E4H8_9ZZZZ
MHVRSYWQFKAFDEAKALQLQNELNISTIVARLLVQRGMDTFSRAQSFLFGEVEDLSDPFSLGGMEAAVVRINQAIEKDEKIIIYGDYDVDGICSVVLMKSCFDQLGYPVDYYVPGRFSEGYGLNLEAVEKLSGRGYSLVISVDCGIKSVNEIQNASALGLDVIITDHHTPGEELPPAVAIVNPRIDGNEKNRDLAGVGVAFKLAQAICRTRGVDLDEHEWLDLVAMATIADIVPLTGDNRIYVKYGLERIRRTRRVGLQALIAECGLEGRPLLPSHVGFALAPRLNSAGRLQNAGISIDLLLTGDKQVADELVQMLSKMNTERRAIEDDIFQAAVEQIEKEDMAGDRVLVLGGEGWHQGVIGIVASRLCDRYNRPSILISWDGPVGRGSGRSILGFDLYQSLENCQRYLLQFGGHKLAAGLTMNKSDYMDFRQCINEWSKNNYRVEELKRRQFIDLEVELDDIDKGLLSELQRFQPCGEGNPIPLLALRNTPVFSPTLVGQGHFKGKVGSKRLGAIAFNRADLINCPTSICYHDQVFELTENEFRGQSNLQLKIRDMKPSYRPDVLPKNNSFSSGLIRVVEKCLHEIEQSRPALFICPTYRSLIRHVNLLQSFFRPDVIAELHGKLPAAKRKMYEDEFIKGKNKIYVISASYLRYFLENNALPGKLRLLIQTWPDTLEKNLLYYIRNCEIDTIEENVRNTEWTVSPVNNDCPGRTLIYANRNKTIKKLIKQFPGSKTEAGLANINERRKIRQEFWQITSSSLITDGAYSGCNTYDFKFDQVLFADAPFSYHEARFVLEQVKEDCPTAGILFDGKDIRLNRNYLSRMYPEPEILKTVLECFQSSGKNPIDMEITDLALLIGKYVGREFSPFDMFPVLYILVDLGLCQINKKGSIIEIKFKSVEKQQLAISRSPYYLEGKYEKQSFVNLVDDLNKILLG